MKKQDRGPAAPKHTPGPWRMEPRSINGQLQHWGITDGTGFDIATIITDDNAKLIAAAPALADGVEACLKAMRVWGAQEDGIPDDAYGAYMVAESALRAAGRLATAGSASASEPPASQDLTNPAAASEKGGGVIAEEKRLWVDAGQVGLRFEMWSANLTVQWWELFTFRRFNWINFDLVACSIEWERYCANVELTLAVLGFRLYVCWATRRYPEASAASDPKGPPDSSPAAPHPEGK